VSPEDYVKSISAHSRRSIGSCLFPGQNYKDLVDWISTPKRTGKKDLDKHCMAILYDFACNRSKKTSFFGCSQLSDIEPNPTPTKASGQVLAIRGVPTGDWIGWNGGKFKVDPEFFNRHLDFFVTLEARRAFFLPSLPSTTSNIIRLRVNTILYQGKPSAPLSPQKLLARRLGESEQMATYHRHFQRNASCGDSVVRQFTTIDENYAILEQDVSICMGWNGESWTALVLFDVGRDLANSPEGPWTEEQPALQPLPVMQHHIKMTLRQTNIEKAIFEHESHPASGYADETTILQNTALLPFELDTFLDDKCAAIDPYYALTNIFRHSAFSTMQVVNLLQYQVDREMGVMEVESQRSISLENLQFFETMLSRHIRYIKDTIRILKGPEEQFSSGRESDNPIVASMAASVLQDYKALLYEASALSERCTKGMNIIMNRAVVAESRKAIEQTNEMKKLTLLATFFIPLSFTASFFGMNFKELGQGGGKPLSIWIWVVVSIPLVLLAYGFYFFNIVTRISNFLARLRPRAAAWHF